MIIFFQVGNCSSWGSCKSVPFHLHNNCDFAFLDFKFSSFFYIFKTELTDAKMYCNKKVSGILWNNKIVLVLNHTLLHQQHSCNTCKNTWKLELLVCNINADDSTTHSLWITTKTVSLVIVLLVSPLQNLYYFRCILNGVIQFDMRGKHGNSASAKYEEVNK